MHHFETVRVFSVVPENGDITLRHNACVEPVDFEQPSTMYRSLFHATGLHRMDFAVFGANIDENGVEEHGLVVLSEQQGTGLLADADYLARHPEYLTAELAKKVATVSRTELEDFTIQPFLDALAYRFPHARGFTK